jgi:hypothetical protein
VLVARGLAGEPLLGQDQLGVAVAVEELDRDQGVALIACGSVQAWKTLSRLAA